MTRPCGATRPSLRDAGWECTGSGLIVVSWMYSGTLPIVLPARALDVIEPDSWWALPVQRFAGGDHVHLCVPRRPASFKGNAVYVSGDAAQSCLLSGGIN